MPKNSKVKKLFLYLLQVIALGLIYFIVALAGLKIAPAHAHVTSVWFPAGIGLAALLHFGIRLWPGTLLGPILLTQSQNVPWIPSIISGVGDMLSSLIGALILTRLLKFNDRILTFKDAIALILFGAVIPTMIGGSLGAYSIYLDKNLSISFIREIFQVWWLADLAGVLTLTPFLLSIFHINERKKLRGNKKSERALLFALLFLSSWMLIYHGYETLLGNMLPFYLILPFIVWSALRFQLSETGLVVFISSITAISSTFRNFSVDDPAVRSIQILQLQVFISSMSAIGLILSAAIRQQRKARNLLADSEARLKTILQHEPECVSIFDSEGRLIEMNPAGLSMLDAINLKEVAGKSIYDMALNNYHKDLKQLMKGVAHGEKRQLEFQVKGLKGSIRWLEVHAAPLKDKALKRVLLLTVMRDISERKKTEAQRENLLRQETEARLGAEKSIQLRDDFLSIASHELKTPLTPLKMQIQLIKRSIQKMASVIPNSETILGQLERSEKQFDRLHKLVNNLLDVSRITADRLILELEECDLSELVREVVELFRPELEQAGIKLKLNIQPNIKGRWDRVRIQQVVSNLLLNAKKYGRSKPVEVSLQLAENAKLGTEAKIMVQDHGIGISKDEQEKIFGRFERLAPLENYDGLGLGLFICRSIVKAHGGLISVQSSLNDGSIFTVELPLQR